MADAGAGRSRGHLVVIGGAEGRREGTEAILARFVDLSGGAVADIAVLATASVEPKVLEAEYVEVFTRLGAAAVRPLPVRTRADANADDVAAVLSACTGVFFTGGDQRRIATVVGGSRLDSLLHQRVEAGEVVLGGTSAGAAMMSGTMVLGGDEAGVTTTAVRTGPGMEFLSGVLIDMHFAERGRLNRLLSAIALYPHELGLGIDEDTAIVVRAGRFEVIGTGSVTVIDAGRATMIRTPAAGDGAIALSGVSLHVLPPGYSFELTGRHPIVVDPPADTQEWGASA